VECIIMMQRTAIRAPLRTNPSFVMPSFIRR
jgi:hypothetical protein